MHSGLLKNLEADVKINKIEIFRVSMPLIYPFRTAFGNDEAIESVLVCLSSGELNGWGESACWKYPAYSPEYAAGQFLISRDLITPLLLGQEIASGGDLQKRLVVIKGNQFAKAAFDLAWWDLYAKSLGKPLWRLLGGQNPLVEAGADFGIMETIDLLLETIQGAVTAGYQRVKLKYRPGWELEMVAAVRQNFPDLTIHVDCNSAYTLDDLPMFKKLDRYHLAMIEQPLMYDDLIDHAALQTHLETPICLDESITSPEKARKAIQIKACRWVNIKPGRVGGITNALTIHNLCQEAGIPCWIGGMLESAVGAAHCIALATLPNIHYPSDIFPTSRFYVEDLGQPAIEHSEPGKFCASDQSGIGVIPNPLQLEKMGLEQAILSLV
jgi:o-succinylbenzoate synthase